MKPERKGNGIQYLVSLVIISSLLFTLLLPGCNQMPAYPEPTVPPESTAPPSKDISAEPPGNQPQTFTVSSAPLSEMAVDLSMEGLPVLGHPVKVTASFGLRENVPWDAENVTALIILPEEFELVSGQLEWHGDVLRGKKYEISATIKAVNTGENFRIEARVSKLLGPHDSLGGAAQFYTRVSEDSGAVSEYAFPPKETPRPTPAEPPTGPPSKPPAEPGDIAPQPNLPPNIIFPFKLPLSKVAPWGNFILTVVPGASFSEITSQVTNGELFNLGVSEVESFTLSDQKEP